MIMIANTEFGFPVEVSTLDSGPQFILETYYPSGTNLSKSCLVGLAMRLLVRFV